jgi:plasmid stability protein
MKIMASHSSATAQEETHQVTETKRTRISDALRRRAQSLIHDRSIEAESRALIRYGLETNDPLLAELVRRADAGESLAGTLDFLDTCEADEDDSSEKKLEELAEIIFGAGTGSESRTAALFVLMGLIEHSRHPKLIANSVKHIAFNRCGELNLYGMVDTQIEVFEGELLADTHGS